MPKAFRAISQYTLINRHFLETTNVSAQKSPITLVMAGSMGRKAQTLASIHTKHHDINEEIVHAVKGWLIKTGRDAQKRSFEQSRRVLSSIASAACGDFLPVAKYSCVLVFIRGSKNLCKSVLICVKRLSTIPEISEIWKPQKMTNKPNFKPAKKI